jgi:hypothetical protein
MEHELGYKLVQTAAQLESSAIIAILLDLCTVLPLYPNLSKTPKKVTAAVQNL